MVLTALSLSDKGRDLATTVQRNADKDTFSSINILPHICKEPIPIAKILISKDHKLNDEAPGLVIFTSGTTGPPKGALYNRSMLSSGRGGIVDWYDLTPKDVVYHGLPVHHATGIGVTLLPFIIAGACIEFHAGEFKPERVWSRWLKGGITIFSGVPTMYARLMQYFDTHIAKLPKEHRGRYIMAAREVRIMFSGSAAIPQPLQAKWIKVLGGRRILERYGSTEAGAVFAVEDTDLDIPDVSDIFDSCSDECVLIL
jgi:malonyl-CoA/methylmalonyl-CoA synthetase